MRFLALLIACMPILVGAPAHAEDLVWATGRVVSADGKRPIADAIVAVYGEKGKVLDYARTDSDGNYTLAVPRDALHLDRKGGGFLHQVVGGVGRLIGGVAGPLKYGIRAAASAASIADPIAKVGVGAASGLAQTVVDTMAPNGKDKPMEKPVPGALVMKVSATGCNDALAMAHVYWMQEEVYRAGGKEQRGISAWFDPANLTATTSEKPSTVESPYLLFANARITPSIVEPGATAVLTASFPQPPDPRTPVVVVARNSRTGRIYELRPDGGDLYQCEMLVDRAFPKNDQTFCVVAYAEQAEHPGRSKAVESAIEHAGMLDPHKPYVYNPLVAVSRNRADVTLTVVAPARRR